MAWSRRASVTAKQTSDGRDEVSSRPVVGFMSVDAHKEEYRAGLEKDEEGEDLGRSLRSLATRNASRVMSLPHSSVLGQRITKECLAYVVKGTSMRVEQDGQVILAFS